MLVMPRTSVIRHFCLTSTSAAGKFPQRVVNCTYVPALFGRSERLTRAAGALPARLTFDGFLRTSPGRLLLEWEAEAYDELTVDVFGSCALQIGMPELNTLARKSYAVEVADRAAECGFRFADVLSEISAASSLRRSSCLSLMNRWIS